MFWSGWAFSANECVHFVVGVHVCVCVKYEGGSVYEDIVRAYTSVLVGVCVCEGQSQLSL